MSEGSYVWLSSDIRRLAEGGVLLAPSWEFAAGVAWLAGQLNASVRLPERRETAEVTVMIDEVTR